MDASDNSSDFNDLEVAAVMAFPPFGDEADSTHCCSVPIIPAANKMSPKRSSTVLTNVARGNAVSDSPPPNTNGNIDCVDSTGKTPLMLASVCGWIDVVRFLIERGASVDVTDEQGASALHMVCSVGHRNVVEALIEYGADVDAISQDGNSPLHYAVYGNHKDCVRYLLSSGADVTIKNSDSLMPTDLALRLRKNEILDIFKDYLLRLFGE